MLSCFSLHVKIIAYNLSWNSNFNESLQWKGFTNVFWNQDHHKYWTQHNKLTRLPINLTLHQCFSEYPVVFKLWFLFLDRSVAGPYLTTNCLDHWTDTSGILFLLYQHIINSIMHCCFFFSFADKHPVKLNLL